MALVSAPNSYELHERMADGRFERVYEFGTSQWSARLEQSSDGRSFVILEGSGSGRVVVLDRDELGGWQVRADPGFWLTGTKSVAFLADGSIVIGVDGRGLWRISGDQLMISPVWTRAELVVPMEGGQAAVVFARDPPVSLTFVDGAEEASVVCSGLNAVTSAAALHGTLFLTAGEAIYAATRSGCVPTGLTADGGDLVSGGSVVHIIGEDGICEGQTQRVIALGAEPPIR